MDSGVFVGHYPCDDCESRDNLAVYSHDDGSYTGTCFGCKSGDGSGFKSNNKLCTFVDVSAALGLTLRKSKRSGRSSSMKTDSTESKEPRKRGRKRKPKEVISESKRDEIVKNTSIKGSGFRGIKDKWLKHFGVRTEYGDERQVVARYYPATAKENGKTILTGYHKRIVEPEKDFRAIGRNTIDCHLFGQLRAKTDGKLVITGGQEDCMAAMQMFDEYREGRGYDKIAPVDFVSGNVGEGNLAEQIQANYEFIDNYSTIILDLDDDVAGEKALQACLDVLPTGKIKVMSYSTKDANDALEGGITGEYVSAIYNSKSPNIAGILGGVRLLEEAIEACSAPLIPLPPEFKTLEDKLCGGFPSGEIINILAASGAGKTTIANVLITYWIHHSPYKIGVVSLEASAGKFSTRLFSNYLGQNIAKLSDPEAKREFLEANREKLEDLLLDEDGNDRFSIVDDKGELDNLRQAKKTIERLVRQAGCKVIIIDPLQDLLDYLSNEDQAEFVGWQKKIKARDGVTFININHTRKSGGGGKAGSEGGELTEEDMQGTSAIYKSGAVNIIIMRNKAAEDEEERNTTRVKITKSRDVGDTGPAGNLYYTIADAKLWDKSVWVEEEGSTFDG